MSESELVELLISQKSAALDLWKNLLTVGLGILAYYGAMQNRVSLKITYSIIAIFVFFAFSNARALWLGFGVREKLNYQLCLKNSENPLVGQLVPDSTWQYLNIAFHVTVDILVVFLVLTIAGVLSSNKSKYSDGVNAAGV